MLIVTWAVMITLCCYAVAMVLAMFRLLIGPALQDRILAADFIFNIAMLTVLVLSIYYSSSIYYEIAFLMVLFGFVSSLSMSKFLIRGEVIE